MCLKKVMAFACCITCSCPFVADTVIGEEGEGNPTSTMADITVTANKVEENIQDVPQSITVIDEVVLDDKGITSIPDIMGELQGA